MNSLVEARFNSRLNWEEDFLKEGALKASREAESREESKEVEKVPESFRAQIARVAGRRRRESRARVDKDCSIFRKDNNSCSSVKDRDSGCYTGSGSSEEETLGSLEERQAGGIQGCSAGARNTLIDFKFWRGGGRADEKGWEGSCSSNSSPASSLRTGANFLPPRSLPPGRSRARGAEVELPGSQRRGGSSVGHNSGKNQRDRRSYSSSEVTTSSSSGMIR